MNLLGAIQIIRDTYLDYFRPPPSPMWHLVTLWLTTTTTPVWRDIFWAFEWPLKAKSNHAWSRCSQNRRHGKFEVSWIEVCNVTEIYEDISIPQKRLELIGEGRSKMTSQL
jgi:hypothetical protein